MKLAEASRQYQLALEHERLMRGAVGGLLTFEHDLDLAHKETERTYADLLDATFDAEPSA